MTVKKREIVIAGHISLDLTPAFPGETRLPIEEIFVPGQLRTAGRMQIHVGGAVGNCGMALHKFGANVRLMSKIGTDQFGSIIKSIFGQYGTDRDLSISSETETSYTVVLSPPGIDRMFLNYPGTNDTYGLEDIPVAEMKKTALFHFGYPPLMKRMYQNQGQELIAIYQKLKGMGIATSLDMAFVDENSEAAKTDWKKLIRDIIPDVDFFVPSAEELAYMIDLPLFRKWQERAKGKDITEFISIEKDIKPLGQKLIDWGAKVVLIKCGAAGMYLCTGKADAVADIGGQLIEAPEDWSEISHFEASYEPDRILSATGAGDTSIAAFLYAITEGYSWQRCLQLAAGTGASCVTSYDSLSGLLTFPELENKIDSGWKKCYSEET